MARKLTRKEMREQLYRMLFQLEFHKDAELDEQLALFMDDLQEIREADRIELADKFHGVAALAVYEIMFDENVPDNVAVNEAVELAKQYCGDSSPRYINGVLAAVVRERSNTDAETQ